MSIGFLFLSQQSINIISDMQFPSYLKGIINANIKNKELEEIKRQIRQFLPDHALHSQNSSQIEIRNNKPKQFRKTVSNFSNCMDSIASINSPAPLHQMNSISRLERKLQQARDTAPVRKISIKRQMQEDHSNDHMTEWRREMLRHIRPQRQINVNDLERQSIEKYNKHKPVKPFEQVRIEGEKKLFKVRTSPSLIRNKFKSATKFVADDPNEKKIILIRPTPTDSNDRKYQQELQKAQKRQFKYTNKSKYSPSVDNFCLPLSSTHSKESINWNDLALQRIANFKALLPYLDTHKAKVGVKPERKDSMSKYEPSQSLKQERVEKSKSKQQVILQEKITGWETHQT